MDHARASGSPIRVKLGGQLRTFRRLSRRDFATIIEHMPGEVGDRMYRTPWDVNRWAQTVDGAAVVLAVASLVKGYTPEQLDERLDEIRESAGEWGSMIQQAVTAQTVTAESLISGDEPPVAEGEQRPDPPSATPRPETTPTKRD